MNHPAKPGAPSHARRSFLAELGAAFAPADGERPADAAQRAISTVLGQLSRTSAEGQPPED